MPALVTPHPARHPSPTVRASSLSHLIFERPDLVLAEDFLTDFGLLLALRTSDTLYMRGTSAAAYCYRAHHGRHARFVGLGFTVDTRGELERLAGVEGATPIARCPHPGGGEFVRLHDPSGFTVEVVHGQTPAAPIPTRAPMPLNLGEDRPRINDPQRPPAEPPDVMRLGHLVLEVADFQATCSWYAQHLGFLPSDVQVLPDGSPAVAFLRLDRGEIPADHHTLALAQSFTAQYGHSAYEVVDADAVGMGQRSLREKGWQHAWGIGRHILGSQIFDYWSDPWGDKHEHYCDGDVFTAEHPMGVHPATREVMSQWGETMPASFTRPNFTPKTIASLVRNLRRSPDLTLKKLLTLAKIFG